MLQEAEGWGFVWFWFWVCFFLACFLVCLAQAKGKKDEFSDLAIKLHSNTLLLSNNFQGVSY